MLLITKCMKKSLTLWSAKSLCSSSKDGNSKVEKKTFFSAIYSNHTTAHNKLLRDFGFRQKLKLCDIGNNIFCLWQSSFFFMPLRKVKTNNAKRPPQMNITAIGKTHFTMWPKLDKKKREGYLIFAWKAKVWRPKWSEAFSIFPGCMSSCHQLRLSVPTFSAEI